MAGNASESVQYRCPEPGCRFVSTTAEGFDFHVSEAPRLIEPIVEASGSTQEATDGR